MGQPSLNHLGANGDLCAYNLYAYCSNNPVENIDKNETSTAVAMLTWWSTTMWWVSAVDGLIPIGDIIYVGGAIYRSFYVFYGR